MKLGIVAAPAPRPVLEPAVQATVNREITAARRARLAASANFRRALRAVLSSPA